jgi:CheY-like chemotaxis protein
VISLSGLVAPGHRERCLAAGANGCLAKPFGIKDLERVIKEFLVDPK